MGDAVSLDDLVADPDNRRLHPQRNLDMLGEALGSVGAARSIVIDEDNAVLAGNGVVAAARAAGLTRVHVIDADGQTVVAVRRRGLSAEQKRDLALYDNRTAELAEWNLGQLLTDKELGMALQPFWTPGEEAVLLANHQRKGNTAPDAVPETRATSIGRGDVFTLGRHRLVCGDATNGDDLARLTRDARPTMVFTDPPYGLDLDTDYRGMTAGKSYQRVAGDDHPYDPGHLLTAFAGCDEMILWGADYYAERLPGRNAGSWFVWDKAAGGDVFFDDYDKMYGSNFELAWSRVRHKRALVRVLWKGIFGLSAEDTRARVHPTQKPVALATWFFEHFLDPEGVVVDCFLGSGSTIIAAEQMRRRCLGLEIDPIYCQVIIDRWEAFTGERAEKVG